ncbi:MAG: chaperone modulator CbpM [Candidatus Omnitrophica bacterium]|nr:chaperone modulator CbpM [Candidatus Omnitrophota bacterium]
MKRSGRKRETRKKIGPSEACRIITAYDLAFHFGKPPRLIKRLVDLELIEPVEREPELYFSTDIIPKIEKLMRLHYELGVSWPSMDFVLELLDKIDELSSR